MSGMVTSATNAAALVQAPGDVATGIGAVGVAAAGVVPDTVGVRVAVAGKVVVIMGVVAVVGATTMGVPLGRFS